jgi:hypothetical protein
MCLHYKDKLINAVYGEGGTVVHSENSKSSLTYSVGKMQISVLKLVAHTATPLKSYTYYLLNQYSI